MLAELHQTEAALRESEARFRMLADNISQLAWTCGSLGNVNWYNRRWLDYTGLSFDEMKSWGWERVQHPDHEARVVAGVERAAASGKPWEDTFPLRRHDGEYRWFYSQAVPVRDRRGEIVQWFGTNTDVTDQRQAAEALRESETRNRLLVESWAQAEWETDAAGMVVADSPSWRAYTGQTLEEWLGYGWLDAVHPDDRAYAERQWREAIAARELVNAEFRLCSPSGTWRWTNVRAAPVLDGTGMIEKWAGINVDIDARKQTETALRESEERRDLALEATQLGTFVWHVRADRGEPDERMLALFDQPTDGRTSLRDALATMIHPEDGGRYADAVAGASEPAGSGELHTDIRVRRHDGGWRWLEIRGRVSFGDDGQPLRMAGTALDITDRKQAEQALRDSEERLRLLVAELQHRVRNILTVVRLTFSRTFEGDGTREDLADHFLGRLGAMARTQVALTRHADRTANLENIIRDELLSVGVRADGGAVTLAGPEVELDYKTAESLAMALHELTTNALKYGALSVTGATLDVTWRVNMSEGNKPVLDIDWNEQGVPAIAVRPARRGLGRELIEEALPYRLGAEARLEFRGGGVRCAISIPLGTESSMAVA